LEVNSNVINTFSVWHISCMPEIFLYVANYLTKTYSYKFSFDNKLQITARYFTLLMSTFRLNIRRHEDKMVQLFYFTDVIRTKWFSYFTLLMSSGQNSTAILLYWCHQDKMVQLFYFTDVIRTKWYSYFTLLMSSGQNGTAILLYWCH
jgi:hypothetical protein